MVQKMKRPVWEPPGIEITGLFDNEDGIEVIENLKIHFPDPTLRCEYLDLWMECEALREYTDWICDAANAAVTCDALHRQQFYAGLLNALEEERKVMGKEHDETKDEALRQLYAAMGLLDVVQAAELAHHARLSDTNNQAPPAAPPTAAPVKPIVAEAALPIKSPTGVRQSHPLSSRSPTPAQSHARNCCNIL